MPEAIEHDHLDETEKINVVPLADVSLVLLIILMILSPSVMQSMIKVQTPGSVQARAQKLPESNEPLLIEIRSGGLFLNNAPIASALDLVVQLRLKLGVAPERPVLISPDSDIPVDQVVSILDLAKQNGAQKVSLLKKAEPHNENTPHP